MADNLEVEVSYMAVVAIRGEIDIAGVTDLHDVIERSLAPGQTIVFDLSGVTFADSTLIAVLQKARSRTQEIGGAVLIRNPSSNVRKLLTLGQLGDLAQIEVDRQNELP